MFALKSRWLRRRLSAPTSGSARRRARERELAKQTRAEGERIARERREQRYKEKLEQQRQAREELASYEPWGRAGGGAPNAQGIKFSNLRATGIYPEDELKGISKHEACRRFHSPRRRKRTPLRLYEDPQICYAEKLRQTVDNDIRYRQTPDQQQTYKQILDDMVDKRKKATKEEMKKDLEYERKMQTMDGPWGRPGPGGTAWRNPRDIGLNFSKSMGWTNNDVFNKMKGDHKRQKRSSLTLPKVKRDDDSKENYPPENDNENVENPSNIEKLPDIKHTNSANNGNENQEETRRNSGEDRKIKAEVATTTTTTTHKGKRSPKKNKYIKSLSNGDRVRRMVLDDVVDTGRNGDISSTIEQKLTPETAIFRLTGGVELVPLLARRRRIGARTLHSSDVTRPPEQSCEWREIIKVGYLSELKDQMRVKYQQKEESRLDSAKSVQQHHETWASLWGRPGHGAPLRGRYARSNLAHLLYVTPLSNAQ